MTTSFEEVQPPPPLKEVLTPENLGGLEVSEVKDDTYTSNWLIYGGSGVGKTVLSGSASEVPEMSPVLHLNIEGGTLSLRKRHPTVKTTRITRFSQIAKAYKALKEGNHPYKTVVVDTIDELQKFGMYEVMEAAVREDRDRDPDRPQFAEWAKSSEQMRRVIRAFRDLRMNTIFVAHARTDKDNKGRITIRPALSAKLADEVAGFLDVVLYMSLVERDEQQFRILQTVATAEVTAKDRTDSLPPTLQNTTFSELYNIAMRQ